LRADVICFVVAANFFRQLRVSCPGLRLRHARRITSRRFISS
jgi:hypothetical protein